MAAKAQLSGSGKIAALGYCWGGTIAWRAAVHVDGIAAAVCYYATQIGPYIAEKPRCPVLMHFGESDPIATLEHAGQLRAAQGAQVEIQVYPAGHGFNCDEIASFHQPSAASGAAALAGVSGRPYRVKRLVVSAKQGSRPRSPKIRLIMLNPWIRDEVRMGKSPSANRERQRRGMMATGRCSHNRMSDRS